MSNISELEASIREAAEHYYKGNPILTDLEFDELLNKLKEDCPNHPILKAIGWGYMPEPGDSKEEHIGAIIGSLDKIKIDDVDKSLLSNCIMDKLHMTVLMPKLDGGSLVAYYQNGLLDKVLTRGDGYHGINITRNIYHNLPTKIENHGIEMIAIRGEAIITYEDFESMEGSNPRNKCAGILQSKNGHKEDLKKVKFIPYSIVSTSVIHDLRSHSFLTDKTKQLLYFAKNDFEIIPYVYSSTPDIYDKFLDVEYLPDFMMKQSSGETLPVDGLVITRAYIDFTKSEDGKYNYYSCESKAFKYADVSKRTKVIDINWQMSSGSKFVPVLKIDPIEIDGVNIHNVTANNYKWLSDRKCGIGSEIEVKRANEVIPNMHMVITESSEYNAPVECPLCKEKLSVVGTDLVCTNQECPQVIFAIINKVWEFIKPDGASNACFNIFFNNYVMAHEEDMFSNLMYLLKDVGTQDSDKKYTNHYHKLIQKAIDGFKDTLVDLPDLIKMANIPTLGRRIGKRIKETISFSDFITTIEEKKMFPETVFKYAVLNDSFNRKKLELIFKLWDKNYVINHENKKEEVKEMRELRVAATGAMSIPRSKWFKEMAQYGVEKVSVGKKCDYLVCNEESTSSSYVKAQKLNIPIVSENVFMEIVKGV
jgi:DNA ligase (NAD+)